MGHPNRTRPTCRHTRAPISLVTIFFCVSARLKDTHCQSVSRLTNSCLAISSKLTQDRDKAPVVACFFSSFSFPIHIYAAEPWDGILTLSKSIILRSLTMPVHNIAIAGAGLTGLAAAIALRQAGHNVQIYERVPAFKPVRERIFLHTDSC